MHFFTVVPYYLRWHYSTGIVDYLRVWRNFIWFFNEFFSIRDLLRTLFAPWRRLGEEKERHFDAEKFFERVVVNTLMRLVGATVRFFFIAIGMFVQFLVIVGGALAFVLWLALPFIIVLLFVSGITLLVI